MEDATRAKKPRRTGRTAATSAALVLTTLPPLLRRMTKKFDSRGGLDRTTTAWMYAVYAAHATLHTAALVAGGRPTTKGWTAVGGGRGAAGGLLCVRGMARFSGPAMVSGTAGGAFVTDGAYALTRNPQYAGYLMLLAGTAVARRSVAGMVLTGAAATVLNHWIPVEERHLRSTCGAAYDEYAEEVPRWPIATLHLSRRSDGQQFGRRVGS